MFREELAAAASRVQELEGKLEAARGSLAEEQGRCRKPEGATARLEAALAAAQAALKACEDKLVAAEVRRFSAIASFLSSMQGVIFGAELHQRMQLQCCLSGARCTLAQAVKAAWKRTSTCLQNQVA